MTEKEKDGWEKRERGEFYKLGDGEDQVESVSGLLVEIGPGGYDNLLYKLMQENGNVRIVPGSSAIDQQLGSHDVGEFVRLDFTGWGESKAGRKFKEIDVRVWRGDYDDQMKAWPRFRDFHDEKGNRIGQAQPVSEKPKAKEESE